MRNFNEMTVADVVTSYTGKASGCRCGCRGTYRCTEANREMNAQRRGYAVSDDEVSDRSVAMVFNRVKHHHSFFPVEVEDDFAEVQVGNRCAAVYFVK